LDSDMISFEVNKAARFAHIVCGSSQTGNMVQDVCNF
jgi:hypothetical protein